MCTQWRGRQNGDVSIFRPRGRAGTYTSDPIHRSWLSHIRRNRCRRSYVDDDVVLRCTSWLWIYLSVILWIEIVACVSFHSEMYRVLRESEGWRSDWISIDIVRFCYVRELFSVCSGIEIFEWEIEDYSTQRDWRKIINEGVEKALEV